MSETFQFGGDIVWRPAPDVIENANLTRFMRQHGIPDFAGLLRRSTEDVAWFTGAVLEFLDVRFQRPFSRVLDLSRGPQWPRWCVDGQMNIVTNCLDKWTAPGPDWRADRTALAWEGEEGAVRSLTFAELQAEVDRCANALRSLGLGKGDPVGLFMPMTPEIVIALLAVARIGGVILPLFSGFGAGAVAARLADAGAVALFTADGAFRRGKAVAMKTVADEAAARVPTLKHQIVLQRVGMQVPMRPGRDHWWHELVPSQPAQAETEPTDAEDVLMIIYTSGTTGRPKGAVHTHCGFPVKAAQDMAFGTDVHPGDVITWMTDMGWMMGPWLVFGALILGTAFFISDTAPDYPEPDRVWRLVERHRLTHLGLSPTFVRAVLPHGAELATRRDLSSLRFFASTGEPWNPDPWMWLFEQVGGGTRPIINYSGGTEISGGIVMGNPLLPLKPCAFSAPCPGMAADVLDEDGRTVRNAVGELVIKAPWIGMTRGFWQDPERYLEAYWSRWPDTWVHGDFAAVDADGQWYILGRSDDTIKVAGKRLGPAEVESILVGHPDVVEAAVIGVPDEVKGSAVVALVVPVKGPAPSNELRSELQRLVAEAMGKPLAPREVLFVDDLPKTRNAKVMRRVIRAAYLGQDPGDISSLVNPEAVAQIRKAV
jgi:acetyl-CoA synthetase